MQTRVAIYARVSTTNHGQDVSLQTPELRQFAEARGWQMAGEYVDTGVSGAKDSRPELNRLMADAHRVDAQCSERLQRPKQARDRASESVETTDANNIESA